MVLADTHVRAGRRRDLPPAVWHALAAADVVLHAGDLVDASLLERLAALAPVHAVLGNNDTALAGALPETLTLTLGGVRVALVHDSGARAGRAARVHRWFPDADLVVFGHSHQPLDEAGVDGQRLFNPGSPTERRRAPWPSYGELVLAGGTVVEHHIVALPVQGST